LDVQKILTPFERKPNMAKITDLRNSTIQHLSRGKYSINVDCAAQIAWHKNYGAIIWMLLVRNYKKAKKKQKRRHGPSLRARY